MASEVNHHVGYSRENECWFVRFYPYQTEQQANEAAAAFTRPAPAATDTGLETAEYQVRSKLNGHWVKDNFLSQQLSPDTERRELVTRSQAAELLAAERAEKEKLEAAWLEAEGIISDLKADNAAKDARIKELDDECNELVAKCNEIIGQRDHAVNTCAQMEEDKDAIEAKLAAAQKELESYKSIVKDVCESQRGTKWGKSAECIFDAIERAVLGGKPS